MYEVLSGLVRLLAPFLPFLAEHVYRNLVCAFDGAAPESVHFTAYPVPDASRREAGLEQRMERVLEAVTLARALRQERNLKVRQPLSSLMWVVPGEATENDLAPFLQIIGDELNVKAVKLRGDDSDLVTRSATANFKVLGKRVGSRMPDVAKAIAALTDEQIRAVESGGGIRVLEFDLSPDDLSVRRVERPGLALKSDGHMTVALDTEITPELEAEGLAREVVHHVQTLRKQSGLEITDRIALAVGTASPVLVQALKAHREYICRETLARNLEFKDIADGAATDANGHVYAATIRGAS